MSNNFSSSLLQPGQDMKNCQKMICNSYYVYNGILYKRSLHTHHAIFGPCYDNFSHVHFFLHHDQRWHLLSKVHGIQLKSSEDDPHVG